MPGNTTLSTLRTTAIVLGTYGYDAELTITATGTITTTDATTLAGATALEAPAGLGTATIDNSGGVFGASPGGTAGVAGLDGGLGIHLAAVGVVGNAGTIAGGNGQAGHTTGGNGGDGIGFDAGGTLDNSGGITGGQGGVAYYTETAGYSGGGTGARFAAAGTVTNTGMITGGKGANNHITFLILPQTGSPGGVGGAGIVMAAGGSLGNVGGTIKGGGGGGHGFFYYGGAGGAGAELAGVSVTNSGLIQGGNAGSSAQYNFGGEGGAGATLDGGGLVNDGTVAGGNGGLSQFGSYGPVASAKGGAGLVLRGGAVAVNNALIRGGDGGTVTKSTGADGGDGVMVDGGTLTAGATSMIAGGAGAPGPFHVVQWPDGQDGAAVRFTALGGTLVLHPGAAFTGDVLGGGAGTLELAGSGGTLGDYGGAVRDFAALQFDPGSGWSVTGSVAALAGGIAITGFETGDTIILPGFHATSQLYVPGTGLVLSDGGAPVTLDLSGALSGLRVLASSPGTDTVVSLVAQIATIDAFTLGPVAVAGQGGIYADALTITSNGTIDAVGTGDTSLIATTADADILNQGRIAGFGVGADMAPSGTLTNEGLIRGGWGAAGQPGWTGVKLLAASLDNSGTIEGGYGAYGFYAGAEGGIGVEAAGGPAMVINAGYVVGGPGAPNQPGDVAGRTGGAGIAITGGGSLTNSGAIAGGDGGYGYGSTLGGDGGAGVLVSGAARLTNTAAIYGGYGSNGQGGGGTGGAGAAASSGGSVTNAGMIMGGHGGGAAFSVGSSNGGAGGTGLELSPGATAGNTGTITGGYGGSGWDTAGSGGYGAHVRAGTTLVNGGMIQGGIGGYNLGGAAGAGGVGVVIEGGRLENHGTIAGGSTSRYDADPGPGGAAVRFNGTIPAVLAIDAGAAFIGGVVADPAVDDTLELMDSAGAGTLAGLGTVFSGFTHVALADGAEWTVGAMTGAYGFVLAGVSLGLDGAALDGATSFDFSAPVGTTLTLGSLSGLAFGNMITGAGLDDRIVATGLGFTAGYTAAYDGGAHTLNVLDGSTVVFTFSNFAIDPGLAHPAFTVGADSVQVACYRRGTRIEVPGGEVPIEALRIGDLIETAAGLRTVLWIARRAHTAAQVAADRALRPVEITPGALGGGLPRRTLHVSPLHGMLRDGHLVPAVALVDGAGIRRSAGDEAVEYFHVELEDHGIIFAEGAPSESYMEVESRFMFDNAVEFVRLYGVFSRDVPACAPRLEEGFELATLVARPTQAPAEYLLGHVERLAGLRLEGWTLDPADPEAAVELEVSCDGMPIGRVIANRYRGDLDRAGLGEGRCAFSFEVPAPMARLAWLEVRQVGGSAALPVAA